MFQPQSLECPCCSYSSRIITEDIHANDLVVQPGLSKSSLCIKASIFCPKCSNKFVLDFMEASHNGDNYLFQCTTTNYTHLQMWRRIENGVPKMPEYHSKKTMDDLDKQSRKIADKVFCWKSDDLSEKDLSKILEGLEDYTQKLSWKRFTKRHFIVAVCAKTGTKRYYHSFNGSFLCVEKNPLLMNAIKKTLDGKVGEHSSVFCNNKIGQCAEVHSSNLCLRHEPASKLSDLRFSIAYHCRTGRPRSYCLNCITLFNLTNL